MRSLYLLTGAAGHLGTALAHQLSERGCAVRALVLPGDANASHLSALPGVEVVRGDICDAQSLAPFFANPEGRELLVIHAAGIVSIASRHIQSVHDVNVGGTKNILALCQAHK
ncbi:MAG: NAD-dependent epimerase/dehydratase family protein, partial [Clostridiales bacterium]|nr:NAD-dependent epimerase/dehydratase family protein [Clostridiales bacterium]